MAQSLPNRDEMLGKLRQVVAQRKVVSDAALLARDRAVLEGEDESEIDAELTPSIDRDFAPELGVGVESPESVDFR